MEVTIGKNSSSTSEWLTQEEGIFVSQVLWLPSWLRHKESACNAGEPGSIAGSGRSPVAGNGNPFQYSCLENFMDRGAWQAIVHGVAKSQA